MPTTNPYGFPQYLIAGNGLAVPVNTGTADTEGSYWWTNYVDGWDGPDVRQTMLPLIGMSGEVASDLHYRGRTLIFRGGWVDSPSEAARVASQDLFAATTDLVDSTGLLTVNDAEKNCLVVIQRAGNTGYGKLTMTDNQFGWTSPDALYGPGPHFAYLTKWESELYMPDPVKYSFTQHSASLGTITNAGTRITTNFQVTVVGAGSSFTITNTTTGATFRVAARSGFSMPSTVVIDFYARTIVDGSAVNRYDLRDLTTLWFGLVPGANALTLTSGSGTVTWRDAWI